MFQTVPDTSSYVKVRHDSIFKQVMTPSTPAPGAYHLFPRSSGEGGSGEGIGPHRQPADVKIGVLQPDVGCAAPGESLVGDTLGCFWRRGAGWRLFREAQKAATA